MVERVWFWWYILENSLGKEDWDQARHLNDAYTRNLVFIEQRFVSVQLSAFHFCLLAVNFHSGLLAVSFCSGLLAVSFPFLARSILYLYIFFMSAFYVVQNSPPVHTLNFTAYGNLRFAGIAIVISDLSADPINQGSSHRSHGCDEKSDFFRLSLAKID